MTAISILLIDADILMRKGLARLLQSQSDFSIVGEAATYEEGIEKAASLNPDLILLEIDGSGYLNIEYIGQVREASPDSSVVVLTHCDREECFFAAMEQGARGYLLKDLEPEMLYGHLRSVVRGGVSISGQLAAKLVGGLRDPNGSAASTRVKSGDDTRNVTPGREIFLGKTRLRDKKGVLTPRQRQVLELASHGSTNKEIADILGVSENTVKNHMQNILNKLRLDNRAQAVAFALREGLLAPRR